MFSLYLGHFYNMKNITLKISSTSYRVISFLSFLFLCFSSLLFFRFSELKNLNIMVT